MPRPQLTAEEFDATRARLTGCALNLYLSEGLDAVSFRRIADAAGVSHTLPYRYFDDKEAVVVAVRVECTRRFENYVLSCEDLKASPLTRIQQIATAYLQFSQGHPREYAIIFAMGHSAPIKFPELLAARTSLLDHVTGALRDAILAGDISGDAEALAHIFWASLHGLISLHVAQQFVHGKTIEQIFQPMFERLLGRSSPTSMEGVAHKKSKRRSSR